MSMAQEPHAFARALVRHADADVIKVANAEPMDGETPAANLAGNLAERIESGLLADRDLKDANPVFVRRAHELNRSRQWLAFRQVFTRRTRETTALMS